MAVVVTIHAVRDPMVIARIDDAVINRYIANRLNDGRNTWARHMSGAEGRDPLTGRSIPGSYPKTDTGRLVNSVDFEVGDREGRLYTDIEYATYLATGTRNMAPRKSLEDALEEVMTSRPATDELARALVIE